MSFTVLQGPTRAEVANSVASLAFLPYQSNVCNDELFLHGHDTDFLKCTVMWSLVRSILIVDVAAYSNPDASGCGDWLNPLSALYQIR